ncbi:hypothetical protein GCM10010156_74480 [Planobispora rosea]|nr:hypothetical protein GCM10010156_74480 [Planobispora rosea]
MTVFAGGATLGAAERVCGVADADGVLASLVDKSLVEVSGGRYRMLETIRAFCAEQLTAAGETERLRRLHADHCLDLVLRAGPRLLGAEQLEWLARLDAERDNLHAALRRAVEAADIERALRLLAGLMPYWWLRGLRSEGAGAARELARLVGTRVPAGLEEEYAVCVLSIASSGSRAEFDEHLRSAVEAVLAAGRPPRQPFMTMLWGMAMGIPDAGTREPVADHRFLVGSDPWSQALGRLGDALTLLYGGRIDDAERELTEALAGFRAAGERWGLSLVHAELAGIAGVRGDLGRALALVGESMAASRELGADDDVADRLCLRAELRARAGDDEGARRDGERAMRIARRAGAADVLARAEQTLGRLARARGDLGEARRMLEAALAACPGGWFGFEETRTLIMIELGLTAGAGGDAATALNWYRGALAAAAGHQNTAMLAALAEALSGVALLDGDGDRAALLLGAGTALRGTTAAADADVARLTAAARARLGGAAFEETFTRGASMAREEALALLGVW